MTLPTPPRALPRACRATPVFGSGFRHAHGQLALDDHIHVVAALDAGRRRMHALLVDHAAAGMIDPHELLHDLGGGGDLETRQFAVERRPKLAQRLLRRISFIHGAGRDRLGKVLVHRARAMRIGNELRRRLGIEWACMPPQPGSASAFALRRPASPFPRRWRAPSRTCRPCACWAA